MRFQTGDFVQFGYGKIPYEVIAVAEPEGNTTYDLICRKGSRKDRIVTGVPHRKLQEYRNTGVPCPTCGMELPRRPYLLRGHVLDERSELRVIPTVGVLVYESIVSS